MEPQKWHHLKTWPEHFANLLIDWKRFEIRKNDRGFQSGDYLVLEEWNPKTGEYTGRVLVREIQLIIDGDFGIPEGTCVMSLSQV